VISRHGCTGEPSLHGVDIHSCAADADDGTAMPGCIFAGFDKNLGVSGNFVDSAGARCDIQGGSANITLPDPSWSTNGTPEAATGSFRLDCRRSDGADVKLEGMFLLPQVARTLLCAGQG
jgi:hypothetical protein